MSRIVFKDLKFQPTLGATDHLLRLFPAGATPTSKEVYDAPATSVGNDGVVDSAEIVLANQSGDGTYDMYLTAVDEVGNESDYVVKQNVPLDVTPPAAPSWL